MLYIICTAHVEHDPLLLLLLLLHCLLLLMLLEGRSMDRSCSHRFYVRGGLTLSSQTSRATLFSPYQCQS